MSMAGDAHPAADDTAPSAERERGSGEDGPGPVRVTGNPTPRELVAVTAAVAAARRAPAVASGPDEPTDTAAPGADGEPDRPDGADGRTEGGATQTTADATPDSRERLAHERRCPVCRERYDSARPLEGPTSVRTAAQGASTVCVDPGSERAYVHSPPPR